MHLLQIEPSGYLFISIAALLITLILARWVLAIDAMLKQQRMQTQLLKAMASKNGVTDEEIKGIVDGWRFEQSNSVANREDEMSKDIRNIAKVNGVSIAIKEAAARRGKGIEEAKDYVQGLMKSGEAERGDPDKDGLINS